MQKWILVIVILAVNAAAMAQQTKAPAADTPFSAFVKKLVAAAPGKLTSFRGAETENGKEHHDKYQGTLTPDADTPCTLETWHMRGGRETPYSYDCDLGPRQNFEEARAVYEKTAAELRASFPQWEFKEKRLGNAAKRDEVWDLRAEQPGFAVGLNLKDDGALEDALSGKPSGKPGVVVQFWVVNREMHREKTVILPRKTVAPAQPEAQPGICIFIEKVLAAKTDGFATLRGPANNKWIEMYEGKLTPGGQSTCDVVPDKMYSCTLR
ncbi:MAG: hypothetical protein LAN71_04495 [Acidobacteriia bacterium]|nr:hypothetical protein [Terriglobia bacterium]